MYHKKLAALALLACASAVSAQGLQIAASYSGETFLDGFNFFTDADPTHGYVNYVSRSEAQSAGLVSSSSSHFTMAVDSTTASVADRGRNSVRLESKLSFADGLYVLDVDHIPVGCGTWPAFWTTTRTGWPVGGEIDVIEGYNRIPPVDSSAYAATFAGLTSDVPTQYNDSTNTASLHTVSTCQLRQSGLQTGTTATTICDATVNGNQGCGVELGNGTIGNAWNSNGGGYYVLWRDTQRSGSIKVYTFPRSSHDIPADLLAANASTIDPTSWTVQPAANFSIPQCSNSTFNSHAIVLNTALCGDLAGNTWGTSGCEATAATCAQFVKENPGAFKEAYWAIRKLNIYTADGNTAIFVNSTTTSAAESFVASPVRSFAVGAVGLAFAGLSLFF